MSKWIRSLALAAAVAVGTAGLVTVSGTVAQGQGKDKDVKTKPADPKTKPADPKPAEVKGTVVISKDKQGKFRYFVKDDANKTLLMGPVGFDKSEDALAALNAAKAILNAVKPTVETGDK